jgi:amphi-Trp domain-containing protein
MNSFHHSFVTDPEDVVRYLEQLIEGFKKGELDFSANERTVRLQPGNIMELSVETGVRKGKVKVALNISWPEKPLRRGREEAPPKGGGGPA